MAGALKIFTEVQVQKKFEIQTIAQMTPEIDAIVGENV